MDRFISTVRMISQLCGFVAAVLTALGVIIVCQMVFVRYVLNENTIWQTEFVTYSLVGATFVGAPYVLLTKGHVNVDVLPLYLGQNGRFYLALIAILMSLAFALVMTVLSFQFWLESWENDWVSDTIWRARLWIPYGMMPIGLGVLSLQYVVDLICLLTDREPPFGLAPDERAPSVKEAGI